MTEEPTAVTERRLQQPTRALLRLEQRVLRALESVEDAGAALREIRNGGHWRHRGYASFEAYVTGFWQPRMSPAYGYRLLEGARVIGALRDGGVPEEQLPVVEALTRRLIPLRPPDDGAPHDAASGGLVRGRGFRPRDASALVDAYQAALDDVARDPVHRFRRRGSQPAPATVEQHVADKLAQLDHPRTQAPPAAPTHYVLCPGGCGHRCEGTGSPQPVDMTGQPHPWWTRTPDSVYWRYDGGGRWVAVAVDGKELTPVFSGSPAGAEKPAARGRAGP